MVEFELWTIIPVSIVPGFLIKYIQNVSWSYFFLWILIISVIVGCAYCYHFLKYKTWST